jgi:hypothetical protein
MKTSHAVGVGAPGAKKPGESPLRLASTHRLDRAGRHFLRLLPEHVTDLDELKDASKGLHFDTRVAFAIGA